MIMYLLLAKVRKSIFYPVQCVLEAPAENLLMKFTNPAIPIEVYLFLLTLRHMAAIPVFSHVYVEDQYTTQTVLKPSGRFYKWLAGFKTGWPDLIHYVHPGQF